MSANAKSLLITLAVAAAVVWASNNIAPIGKILGSK